MRLSEWLLPTIKEIPSDATIISHQLMLRAGMIRQLTSGIYMWLPIGLRVLKKVEEIVRAEMDNAGAIEVRLPCIQPLTLWHASGRITQKSDLTEQMLKMQDRHGTDLLFAPTAEEAMCQLFQQNVTSYRELPKNLYQIGWKFRDEIRPRYGVMRAREFFMKDGYSFDLTEELALNTYNKMLMAYLEVFARMGLTAIPVSAHPGAIGGSYSHEFHVLAKTGESTIYYDPGLLEALKRDDFNLKDLERFYAAEEEKHGEITDRSDLTELKTSKGIEVGHIFYLGDKYSKAMGINIQTQDMQLIHPQMGTYGIGVSRLVGAIIEANHDERGVIWPASVAPFICGLINLSKGDSACDQISEDVYSSLKKAALETLYDDTQNSAGVKFANMDLIGLPIQIIVGKKNAAENRVEVKDRKTGTSDIVSISGVVDIVINMVQQLMSV